MSKHLKSLSLKEFNQTQPKSYDLMSKIEENFSPKNIITLSKALEKTSDEKKNLLPSYIMASNDDNFPKKHPRTKSNFNSKRERDSFDDIEEKVLKYNHEFHENAKMYREKKEENDEFLKQYKTFKKMSEEEDKRKPRNMKGPEAVFSDLINRYKMKGYQIPDLSVKKNLFKPSALLLEENKLVNYFKSKKKKHHDHKELEFLQNMNLQLADKVANEDERSHHKLQRQATMKRNSVSIKPTEDKILTTEELEHEIKKNEKMVEKARETLTNLKVKSQNKENSKSKSRQVSSYSVTSFNKSSSNGLQTPILLSPIKQNIFLNYKEAKKSILKSNHSKEKSGPVNGHNSSGVNISTNTHSLLNTNNISAFSFNNITSIDYKEKNHNPSKFTNKAQSTNVSPRFKTNISKKIPFLQMFRNTLGKKILSPQKKSSIDTNNMTQTSFVGANKEKFLMTNHSSRSIFAKVPKVDLENLYDRFIKKENMTSAVNPTGTIFDDINTYFKENNKYESSLNQTKVLPKHLLRNFSELKFKVGNKDVFSTYKGLHDKVQRLELDPVTLQKIKQMDSTINNFEKNLIRTLLIAGASEE